MGYRPWEISKLDDDQIWAIYTAKKASDFELKMDIFEATRYGAFVSMMPWDTKRKIAKIIELPHEQPTEEEKRKIAEEKAKRRAAFMEKFAEMRASPEWQQKAKDGYYAGEVIS